MADIFISYAKKDRSRVEPLAKALEDKGSTVWWDPIIPTGKDFDDVIEEELSKARCVIVIWTKNSVKSKYVKGEAREALNRDILVPIKIEPGIKPPFDFRSIQTLSLMNWDGSDSFPGFQKLIFDIVNILGEPPVEEQKRQREEARRKAEKERRRKQEEERKLREDEIRQAEEELQRQEEEKKRLAEEKRKFEEEQKHIVSARKAEEERKQEKAGDKRKADEVKRKIKKKQLEEPTSPQKAITNGIGMKFVLIPAGKFVMGSPNNELERDTDERQHEVNISKPFYLQTTQVSQGQWEKVMENNPSKFKGWRVDCPVEQVSWNMAQQFISKLNQMEGTTKYRLPTEAEWEYACRAGTTTVFSFGNEIDKLGKYAWYAKNSRYETHPVGGKKPNAWGLYNMYGNVNEWCQDWYGDYPFSSVADPKGPDNGQYRVLRGGSWDCDAWSLRSANRGRGNPVIRFNHYGFRVARNF